MTLSLIVTQVVHAFDHKNLGLPNAAVISATSIALMNYMNSAKGE